MRKHFSGYVKGLNGAKELRIRLMETERYTDVERILSEYVHERRE
jgi:tRNA-dihydrouridine synthase